MLLLGIETSGDRGSIALMENNELRAERELSGQGRRHAQALAAELRSLFQDLDLQPRDCDGVAVSVGPGSFTGLRIGVTCAKTFAYAVGCPIAAVDSFAAIAAACPLELGAVSVIADAARGDLYLGKYAVDNQTWLRQGGIEIHSAREWIASRGSEEIIIGPGTSRWQQDFPYSDSVRTEYQYPRAGAVCRIGKRLIDTGETADVWGLEPFYLRKSSAEAQWDRRHRQNP